MSKPRYAQRDWSAVIAAQPINREAAVVTSKSNEEVGFRKELNDPYVSDGPAPMTRPPDDPLFTDLTGHSYGRLQVLGFAEEQIGGKVTRKQRGPLWVVRCTCGTYTKRRGKALRSGRITMCAECYHLEDVKRGTGCLDLEKHVEYKRKRQGTR